MISPQQQWNLLLGTSFSTGTLVGAVVKKLMRDCKLTFPPHSLKHFPEPQEYTMTVRNYLLKHAPKIVAYLDGGGNVETVVRNLDRAEWC